MSRTTETFERVLEKLKFREPVPDDIKRFALNNKSDSLISALKTYGEYSLFYRFILKIYYSLGRSGIGLTITQSKIILAAAALFLGASISAGAAVSYKFFISDVEGTSDESAVIKESFSFEDEKLKEKAARRECP